MAAPPHGASVRFRRPNLAYMLHAEQVYTKSVYAMQMGMPSALHPVQLIDCTPREVSVNAGPCLE